MDGRECLDLNNMLINEYIGEWINEMKDWKKQRITGYITEILRA